MKKRVFSLLLALLMVLGLLPASVFAAEGGCVQIENKTYDSLTAAVSAASKGDTLWLIGDDTTEQQVTIDKSLTIELQGHALSSTALKVTDSSTSVTINDRVGTGSINKNNSTGFSTDHNRCWATVVVADGATLTINGVTGTSKDSGTIIYESASNDLAKALFVQGASTLVINGGTFVATSGAGHSSLFVYDGTVTINDGYFYANISYNTAPSIDKPLTIKKCEIYNPNEDGAVWIEQGGNISGISFFRGFQPIREVAQLFLSTAGSTVLTGSEKNHVKIGCGIYASTAVRSTTLADGTIYAVGSTNETSPEQITPEGGKIILAPQIAGGDGTGIDYTWTKDGSALSSANGSTYTINSYSSDDDGSYTVTATEGETSVSLYYQIGGSNNDSGAHSHCVCGGANSVGDHTTHTDIKWTAWTETNSLPTEAGNYYLMEDVTLSAAWTVSADIKLCLNGKTITGAAGAAVIKVSATVNLTITDCTTDTDKIGKITHQDGESGNGVVCDGGVFYLYNGSITDNAVSWDGAGLHLGGGSFNMYGGEFSNNNAIGSNGGGAVYVGCGRTFNMYGGSITGNSASGRNGGGVMIDGNDSAGWGANFNMHGGVISGNFANYGGGVYNKSTFAMSGGEISGNAASTSGGGVYNDNTFKVSGSPNISGNVKGGTIISNALSGGTANNVYLNNNKTITVESEKPLTEGAKVGVTGNLDQNAVTGSTDTTVFTSDDEVYELVADGGNLKWLAVHKHCVCGASTSCGESHNADTRWTAWTETTSLPTAEGNYYLMTNVTLDATWTVSADIKLCLNGKTITGANDSNVIYLSEGRTLDITDCQNTVGTITHSPGATGRGIENSGTLNLWNGSVTGNTLTDDYDKGAGVWNKRTFNMYGGAIADNNCKNYGGGVSNSKTFNMYGGSITCNVVNAYGGGVQNLGTFTMSGGSIENNKVTGNAGYYGGGGVFNEGQSNSEIVLSGNVTIRNNTKNGAINNVRIYNGKLTSTGLGAAASVGITGANGDVVVTGTTNATGFTSDNEDYELMPNDESSLKLSPLPVTITSVPLYSSSGSTEMTNSTKVYDGLAVAHGDAVYSAGTLTGFQLTYTWQKQAENGTYSDLTDAPSDAGSYRLLVKAVKNGVTHGSKNCDFTITKAAGSGSVKITGWTYGDTANKPQPASTTNGTESVTYRYKVKDAADYLSDVPTNAGTYTVEATFAAVQNYEAVTATADFTIMPRTLTVTIEASSKTYDGSTKASVNVDITNKIDGDDISAEASNAVFKKADAGTWTVTADISLKGTAIGNYVLTPSTAQTTAAINAKTLTIGNLTVANKTYDGTNAATISGTPTLVGLVSCDKDKVTLTSGTPTFTSVNAGENIPVSFANFSISGDAAKNYTLTQPEGITANISQAELTITGATVTPKTYDGTTGATITNVTFGDLQNGETLEFGTDYTVSEAQYSRADAGDGNLVSFTVTLSDSSDKARNYKLSDSSGTQTANIGTYAAKGNEYTASTSEWTNQDFTVTAAEGWKLSLTNTADGNWVSSLPRSDETDSGSLTFYVKNDTTGVISTAITKTYKIDKTAPAITGAESGKTYCAAVTLTITDQNLDSVTLNGGTVALTNNKLTVSPATGTQSVVATDMAGNSTTITVTVNNGHTWSGWSSNNNGTHTRSCTVNGCTATDSASCTGGTATCTARAKCATCGAEYGTVNAGNHSGNMVWTRTETTHKQTWSCCNAVVVESEYHEWNSNGVCSECNYVCLHPGAQDDGSCLTQIVCPECKMTTKAAETAHEWGRYIVTTPATTTSEGKETRHCQHVDCKAEDSRTIAKLTPAPAPVETHSVSGIVKGSDGSPLDGAVVALVLGDRQIALATTDADGGYSFEGIEPGVYNLVTQKDGVTMTVKIEVMSTDITVDTITMPSGKTSSVVEVTSDDEADRIDAVVGGLDEIFTSNTVYTEDDRDVVETQQGSVEIKLTVTRKDEKTTSEEITKALQNNGFVGIRFDLTVEKTVTPQAGEAKTTTISDTGALLETVIRLPDELQGKSSYTVYRLHDGAVDTLTTSRNTDGEYIEVSANRTVVTIHARRYSEYVLAYQERRGSYTTTYTITAEDSAHGSVTVSSKSAAKGSSVTLTVKPDEGYLLKTLVVFDEDGKEMVLTDKGDGKYTFAMPGGKVTVSAVFVEDHGYERGYATCPKDATCPIEPYADAVNTAWYHDGVHFCLENGLMQGVSSTSFQPSGDVTRAQVVTILWRLEGKPVANYAMQFADVAADSWYAEAVRWATSAGIVKGYSNTTFAPNDPIKREQFAAILYRYSQFKGYDVSVGEDTNIMDYDDVSSISSYAVPAIQWAGGSGVMTGVSTFTLDPQGVTNRAQAATMFMRYCAEIVK